MGTGFKNSISEINRIKNRIMKVQVISQGWKQFFSRSLRFKCLYSDINSDYSRLTYHLISRLISKVFGIQSQKTVEFQHIKGLVRKSLLFQSILCSPARWEEEFPTIGSGNLKRFLRRLHSRLTRFKTLNRLRVLQVDSSLELTWDVGKTLSTISIYKDFLFLPQKLFCDEGLIWEFLVCTIEFPQQGHWYPFKWTSIRKIEDLREAGVAPNHNVARSICFQIWISSVCLFLCLLRKLYVLKKTKFFWEK